MYDTPNHTHLLEGTYIINIYILTTYLYTSRNPEMQSTYSETFVRHTGSWNFSHTLPGGGNKAAVASLWWVYANTCLREVL